MISKEWTLAERMAVVFLTTDLIRDDINMGVYNNPGRPNIQSVHLLMAMPKEELEQVRTEAERMISDYQKLHTGWSFRDTVKHYESLSCM